LFIKSLAVSLCIHEEKLEAMQNCYGGNEREHLGQEDHYEKVVGY
jgi:hypothetical protein